MTNIEIVREALYGDKGALSVALAALAEIERELAAARALIEKAAKEERVTELAGLWNAAVTARDTAIGERDAALEREREAVDALRSNVKAFHDCTPGNARNRRLGIDESAKIVAAFDARKEGK